MSELVPTNKVSNCIPWPTQFIGTARLGSVPSEQLGCNGLARQAAGCLVYFDTEHIAEAAAHLDLVLKGQRGGTQRSSLSRRSSSAFDGFRFEVPCSDFSHFLGFGPDHLR